MTIEGWAACASAVAALAGPLITYGMVRQKLDDLTKRVDATASKESVETIETHLGNLASKESVLTLAGRIDQVESDVREVSKLVTSVEVLKAEFKGFRELYTSNFDEQKHAMRNMSQALGALVPASRRSTAKPS